MTTKITKLTPLNVAAIAEVYDGAVVLTRSTAEFLREPEFVARTLNEIIARLPGRGHPKASLHAVLRKVVAQIKPVAHDDPRLAELRASVREEV